jgi:hypothetical protein
MQHNRIRLGFGAGLAATAVLAIAGCSTTAKTTAASATATVTTSATDTTTAGSADASTIALVSDVMNKATTAGTVKVDGSVAENGVTMTLSGEDQYSPSLEASLTLHDAGQNINEVSLGHQFYLEDHTVSLLLGTKQWAEVNLAEATGPLGDLSSLVESSRNEDPTVQLAALIASKSVTKVGTETMQGQQTTHYSGTLDASQFLQANASAYPLSSTQLAELKSLLQTGGVTTETIDVWVGSNGLPVQEKVDAHTAEGQFELTTELSGWGAPVQVSAPPASEVTDVTAKIDSIVATAAAG